MYVGCVDPGLRVKAPELRFQVEDPVQTLEAADDAPVQGDRPAGQAGPPAAGDERHVVLIAPPQGTCQLRVVGRAYHGVGCSLQAALDRRVVRVSLCVPAGEHVLASDYPRQLQTQSAIRIASHDGRLSFSRRPVCQTMTGGVCQARAVEITPFAGYASMAVDRQVRS